MLIAVPVVSAREMGVTLTQDAARRLLVPWLLYLHKRLGGGSYITGPHLPN